MFTSSKSALPGHRWRILVAKELKAMFGNQCDIFGFGHKPVKNKNQGIDDYKFSIVIENDSNENYWTEKLSDTLLGYSCPIYSGADNVQDFFHHRIPSFTFGSDPKSAVQKIIKIIDSMMPRQFKKMLPVQEAKYCIGITYSQCYPDKLVSKISVLYHALVQQSNLVSKKKFLAI